MTWTDQHRTQAIADGWELCTVIEATTSRIGLKILAHGPRFKNSQEATQHVINHARSRSALHLFALKKVMNK